MMLTKPEGSDHTHSTRNSLEKCCPRRESKWEKVISAFLMKAEIKCCSSFETLSSYLLTETYIADSFKEKPNYAQFIFSIFRQTPLRFW